MKNATALTPLRSRVGLKPLLPRELYDDSLVALVFTPKAELWIATFGDGTIKKAMDGVVTGGRKVNGHREGDGEVIRREWKEETNRNPARLRLLDSEPVEVFGVYEREDKGNWKHEAKIHYLLSWPDDAPKPRETKEMYDFRKLPMHALLATLEHMRERGFAPYRPGKQPKGLANFTESFGRALDRFERDRRLPGQSNFKGWRGKALERA